MSRVGRVIKGSSVGGGEQGGKGDRVECRRR